MTERDYGLVPATERASRSKQMRICVLDFLYYQPYTTAEVIQLLTGYKTRKGALNILHKLKSQKLVKSYKLINLAGHGMLFWGITRAGCAAIYDPNVHIMERTRGFRTDLIYMTTLDHLIQTQLLECRLMNSKRNISALHINEKIWTKKVPDVLARVTENNGDVYVLAFEVELTIKSKKRYKQIIREYDRHLGKDGDCDNVFWCTDTETKRNKLRTIFQDNNADEFHKFRTLEELKI